MAWAYDDQNIFAKILRGEIPNQTVYESAHSLAFRDINPGAPVHVLVIPKGPYVDLAHFTAEASDEEIVDFNRAVAAVCEAEGLNAEGFRAISNAGSHGVQEVPHLHVHLLGGRNMGPMILRQ